MRNMKSINRKLIVFICLGLLIILPISTIIFSFNTKSTLPQSSKPNSGSSNTYKNEIMYIAGARSDRNRVNVQEEWNKTFGGKEHEICHSVQQTFDGGYILGGYTSSYSAGLCDAWLIKTNSTGVEQWNKTFGGTLDDQIWSVQQTSDGGYIMIGFTESFGAGDDDAWLIKTNNTGFEEWNKTFGGYDGDLSFSGVQTSDGGYILTGETWTFGAGRSDVWLIKTDSNGTEQWNKTFGGSDIDYSYSVQQTSDNGYIIAGTTCSYGAGDNDLWLIKTDSSGNELWNRTFGGNQEDWGFSLQSTFDGGFIITGHTESYSIGYKNKDVWLIKTNSFGKEQWNKTFGGSEKDNGYSVQQTSDYGYIIAGYTFSYGAGDVDFWLIKTDSSGSEQWNKTYGGSSIDAGLSVQQTSDLGYIIAGRTYSYGIGYDDFWIIKINGTDSNHPPIANAGQDQNVFTNQTVSFNGNGSYDLDNDTLAYKWDFGDGNSTGWQSSSKANHSYNSTGNFNVTLTVSDGTDIDSDKCIVHVSKFEPQIVIIKPTFPNIIELYEDFGEWSIKLTDYESHSNKQISGDDLKWYVTGNSNTIFSINGHNSTGKNADTFFYSSIINKYGEEELTFHLYSPQGLNATMNQTVIVHPVNDLPMADAGLDQNVTIDQIVIFDGNHSYDVEGDVTSFKWDFGDDNSTNWQNQSNTSHSYSKVGIYIVSLMISDGELNALDTCIVRVLDRSANLPPLANAGPDQNVLANQTISFDGSGSYDPDGLIISYEWSSSIDGVLGLGKIIQNIKLSAGIHIITLKVSDGELTSTDACIVQVLDKRGNLPPVAKITEIKDVRKSETVVISGAGSYDEDGYITTYIWNFGDNSEEIITNKSEVEHTWSSAGNYTLTLTVIDNFGVKNSVSLEIIVAQSEIIDSDVDGVPDDEDSFPNDAAASVDIDGDKYPDRWNPGKSEKDSTTGLKLDAYPNDPNRYAKEISDNNNNLILLILIIVVIFILLILASIKLFILRKKRQSVENISTNEEILSEMKHKFLQDEPSFEMEYSRNEISGILERKFKNGQVSEQTYHMIKSEVLFSDEIQSDQMINSKLDGKEL